MQDAVFEVYELLAPDGHVFYVGSGAKGRMYQHEKDVRQSMSKYSHLNRFHVGTKSKAETIANILLSNQDIIYSVVFTTRDRKLAMKVECERIRLYGLENLTNRSNGENCDHNPEYRNELTYVRKRMRNLTSPRARGTNPRAMGTNPRATRQRSALP